MEITIKTEGKTTVYTVKDKFNMDILTKETNKYIDLISKYKKVQTKEYHPKENKENMLFVGKLDDKISERDLYDIFGRYGKILCINIIKEDRRKFSYAFIKYEDKRDAEDAMLGEDKKKLNGTRILVRWSRSHENVLKKPYTSLIRPLGPGSLDFPLEDLVKLNMTCTQIRECEIYDWVSVHGDCEYPY